MKKYKVAFVCVHNSCRSQIAEAFGRKLAGDVFESFSAGTEKVEHINMDALRIMKDIYGIDMSEQYSKLLGEIPEVDIVITMGCNVNCPIVKCVYREDWGLDDPSGKKDEDYIRVIEEIKRNILFLKENISYLIKNN